MPRVTNIPRQESWIAEYFRNGGRKMAACEAVGVPYDTLRKWQEKPDFQARMDGLREIWADTLRAAAVKRALEKSDTLLIFMLKALKPEIYDDEIRRVNYLNENKIQDPDAIPVNVVLVREELPDLSDVSAATGSYAVVDPQSDQEH